jgi:hypothetical protein
VFLVSLGRRDIEGLDEVGRTETDIPDGDEADDNLVAGLREPGLDMQRVCQMILGLTWW